MVGECIERRISSHFTVRHWHSMLLKIQLTCPFVFLGWKQIVYSHFFTPGSCIIIVILYCITQLVLWSQPCLRSNCLDQPVHCNEAGWKLPAPLVSCSSAVPCDIHLLSLVWLVNLGWRETLPPLITSAQRAAFNSMNGHGKLCLCHHKQTVHLNRAAQLLGEFPTLAFKFSYIELNTPNILCALRAGGRVLTDLWLRK